MSQFAVEVLKRDIHRCSVCQRGLLSKPNELTCEFSTWAVAMGWQCDVSPETGFEIFCPVCWKNRQKKPASALDLF